MRIQLTLTLIVFMFLMNTMNGQQYMYEAVNSILHTEKSPSYVIFKHQPKALEDRVIPLKPEEGKNGYRTEAHLPFRFILRSKRKTGNLKQDNTFIPFWTYGRIFLDYGFHTRVASEVESGPILPPTNRWGIGLEKTFDLRSNGKVLDNAWSFTKEYSSTHTLDPETFHSFKTLSFFLHHYSNGQPAGVFKTDAFGNNLNRNNYLSGDFSTNFWRFTFSYHRFRPQKYHLGLIAGWQQEFGKDEWSWSFRQEQEGRYGKQRILLSGFYQFSLNKINQILFKKGEFPLGLIEEMSVRIDTEFITDFKKLDLFPYENKYPFSIHAYLDIPIRPLPALGILLHWYRGRDYLNIRYDDPISVFQFGISLELFRHTLRFGDD